MSAMMEKKLNCWEFKQCGREPGGRLATDLGECPAATVATIDGVHDGRNGGRACWVVTGSLCNGERQGTFAQKYDSCATCDFYTYVQKGQKGDFTFSPVLLKKLRASVLQA